MLGEQEISQVYDFKDLVDKIEDLSKQQGKDGITDDEYDRIDFELKKLKKEK